MPKPLLMVMETVSFPLPLQAPLAVMATDKPELAVAAILKLEPSEADSSAAVVTVMVCPAGVMLAVLPRR